VFGAPLGISFFGTAFSEPTLIKLASGYEAATQVRAHNLPTFAATVPFDHVKGPLQQSEGGVQTGAGAAAPSSSVQPAAAAPIQGAAVAAPVQAASTAKPRRMPHHL